LDGSNQELPTGRRQFNTIALATIGIALGQA